MSAAPVVGPWSAVPHSGYGTHYWTLARPHSGWLGGTQYAYTRAGQPRRFTTEAAAATAAHKLNQEGSAGK